MDRSAIITQFPERAVQMSKRKSAAKSLLASYKKKKRKTKRKGLTQKLPVRIESVPTVFDLNGTRRKLFPHRLPVTVAPPANGDSSFVVRMLSLPSYSWGSGRRGCHRNCKSQIQVVKRKRGRPKKSLGVNAGEQSLSPCVSGLSNNLEKCELRSEESEEMTSAIRKLSFAEIELLGNFVYNARCLKRYSRFEGVGKISASNGPLKLSVRLANLESTDEGYKNVILERASLQNSCEGHRRCFNPSLVSHEVTGYMPENEALVCLEELQRSQTRKRRHNAVNLFRSISTEETDKCKRWKGDESQTHSSLPNNAAAASKSKNHVCNTESAVAVPVVAELSDVPTLKSNGHLLAVQKEQNAGDRTVEAVDLFYTKRLEEHTACSMDAVSQLKENPVVSKLPPITIKTDPLHGKVKLVLSKNLCPKTFKKCAVKQQPQTTEDWYCQEVNFTGIRLKRENRKSSEDESVRKPKKSKRSSSLSRNLKKCRPCSVILVDFVKCLSLAKSSSLPRHRYLKSVCCSPDWTCTLKSTDTPSIPLLKGIGPSSVRISSVPCKAQLRPCLEMTDLTSSPSGDVGCQRDLALMTNQFLSSSDANVGLVSVKMNHFPARVSAELIPSIEERCRQETGLFGSGEDTEHPPRFVDNEDGLSKHTKVRVYERSPSHAADEMKGRAGVGIQVKLQFPKLKKIFDSVIKASKASTVRASGVDGAWKERDGGCTRAVLDGLASSCKESSAAQEVALQSSISEQGLDTSIVASGDNSLPLSSEVNAESEYSHKMKRSKLELGAALHTCVHCIFSTPNQVSMREHIYIHTNIIPFMCGLCGALFGTQSAASLHSKRDHPGQDRQIIKDSTINAEDHYMTENATRVADCQDSTVDAEDSKINGCSISKALSCRDRYVKNPVDVENFALEDSDFKNTSVKKCFEFAKTIESDEVDRVFTDLTKGKTQKGWASRIHSDCKINHGNNEQNRQSNDAGVNDSTSKDLVYQDRTRSDLVLPECAEKCILEDTNPEMYRPNCFSFSSLSARNPASRDPGPRCWTRKEDLTSSEQLTMSSSPPLDDSARNKDHWSECKPSDVSEQSVVDDDSHSELPSSTLTHNSSLPMSSVGKIAISHSELPSSTLTHNSILPMSSVGKIAMISCIKATDASGLSKHLLSATLDNGQHGCSTSSKRYSCIHCDYCTSEIADVENHVFVVHPRTKRLTCPVCKCYFCKWKPTMLSHFSLHHPKMKPVLLYEPSYLQKEDRDLGESECSKNSVTLLPSLTARKRSPKRMQVQKSRSVNSAMSVRRSGRLSLTSKVSGSSGLVNNSIENKPRMLQMPPTQQTNDVADESVNAEPDLLEDLNVVDNGCSNVNKREPIGNGCIKTDPDALQSRQPLPVVVRGEEPPSESKTLSSSNQVIHTSCSYGNGKSTKQRNFIQNYLPEENPTLDLDSVVPIEISGTGKNLPAAHDIENDAGQAVDDGVPFDNVGTSNRNVTENILLCRLSSPTVLSESNSPRCMVASDQSCEKIIDPRESKKVAADTGSRNNDSEKFFDSAVSSSAVDSEKVAKEAATGFKDVHLSQVISGSVTGLSDILWPGADFYAILNEESECRWMDSERNVSSKQIDCHEFSVRSSVVDESGDTPDSIVSLGCGGIFVESLSPNIPASSDAGARPASFSDLPGMSHSASDGKDRVDFLETEETISNGDECTSRGQVEKDTFCRTIGEATEHENDDTVESVKVTLVDETDAFDDFDHTRRNAMDMVCVKASTGRQNVDESNRSSEVNRIVPGCPAKDSVSITRAETANQAFNSAIEIGPKEQNSDSITVSQNFIISLSVENASKTLSDKDSHEIGGNLMDSDGEHVCDDSREDEGDVIGAEEEVASLGNLHMESPDACKVGEIQSSREGANDYVLETEAEDIGLLVKNGIKVFEATNVCDDQENDCHEFEKNVAAQSVCYYAMQDPAITMPVFSSDSMWTVSSLSREISPVTGTTEKATDFSCRLETSNRSVPTVDVTAANETEDPSCGISASGTRQNGKLLTDVFPTNRHLPDGMHEKVIALGLDANIASDEASRIAEQSAVSSESLVISDRAVDTDEAVGYIAMDSKEALDFVIASECDNEAINTEVVDFEKVSESIRATMSNDEAHNSVAVDMEEVSDSVGVDRALVCLPAAFEKASDSIIASANDVESHSSVDDDIEEAWDIITATVCNDEAVDHTPEDFQTASVTAYESGDGAINSVALDTEKVSATTSQDDETVAVITEKVLDIVTASACDSETLTSANVDLEKASDGIIAVTCHKAAVVDSQKPSGDVAQSNTFSQLVTEFHLDHAVHSGKSSRVFSASTSTSMPPDAVEQDLVTNTVVTHQGNCSTVHDWELSDREQNMLDYLPPCFNLVQCKDALNCVQDSERSSEVLATSAAVPTVITGGQKCSYDSTNYNKAFDSEKDAKQTCQVLTSLATRPAVLSGGLNVQQEISAISDSSQCSEAFNDGHGSEHSFQLGSAPAAVPTVLAEPESTSSTTSQDLCKESHCCILQDHIRTEEAVSTSVRSEDGMCLEVSSTSDDPAVAVQGIPVPEVMPTNKVAVPASDFATDEELDVETYTEEEPERMDADSQLEGGRKQTKLTEAICERCSFDCGDKEKLKQHLQQVHEVEFENSAERNQYSTVQDTDEQQLLGADKEEEAADEDCDVRMVNVIVIEPNSNFDRMERKRRRSLSTDDSDSLQSQPTKRPCQVAVTEDANDDVIFVREERRTVGPSHSFRPETRLISPASSIRPSDAGPARPSASLSHSRFVTNQADAVLGTESVARRDSSYVASRRDVREVLGQNVVREDQYGQRQSDISGLNCTVPAVNALRQLRHCIDPFLTDCDASMNRSLHASKSSQRTSNPVNFAFVTRAICRPIMSTTLDPVPSRLQAGAAECSSLVGRPMQQPIAASSYYGRANSRDGPVTVVTMATDAGAGNSHCSMAAGVAGPPPLMHISELQMQSNLSTDGQFYPGTVLQNPADPTLRNPPAGSRLADGRVNVGMGQMVDKWSSCPAEQLAHNHGDVARIPAIARADFTRALSDNNLDFARPPVDMERNFTRPRVDMQGDYTARPLAHSHFTRPLINNHPDHVTRQLADNRGDFATRPLVDNRTDRVTRQLADNRGDFATGRSMVPPPAHTKLPIRQLLVHGPNFPPSNTRPCPAVPNVDNTRIPYKMYGVSSTDPNPRSAHLQAPYSRGIFQGTVHREQPLPAHIPQRSQAHLPSNIPHAHSYLRPNHGPFQLPPTRHVEVTASSTNSCLLCSFQASDRWSLYNHILTHSLSE